MTRHGRRGSLGNRPPGRGASARPLPAPRGLWHSRRRRGSGRRRRGRAGGPGEPDARLPRRAHLVLRPDRRRRHRPRRAAGGGRRGGLRRPCVPVRQAGRPLVRGGPSRDPARQAGKASAARYRRITGPVRRGRLHPGPGGRPTARRRARGDLAQPVPARRDRRLPGVGRPGDRARAVPPGRRTRQPPGHQRLTVAGARRGSSGPLPGCGGRPGGAGQVDVRRQPGRGPARAGRVADHTRPRGDGR